LIYNNFVFNNKKIHAQKYKNIVRRCWEMAKETNRITYENTRESIDFTTGEIVHQENVVHKKIGAEPNYIKLYIKTLMTFKELPTTCSPILIALLEYMTYADVKQEQGGQLLVVNGFVKQNISKALGIKVNTIEQALGKFVKAGIFKRIATGTFQVNPHIIGRGEWRNISAIRATFDFNEGTVTTNITTTEEPEEQKD
jgi:hypothetical protein